MDSIAISDDGEYFVVGSKQAGTNSDWNRIYLFESGNEDYLDYSGTNYAYSRGVAINSDGTLFASCNSVSLNLFSRNIDNEIVEEWSVTGGCRVSYNDAKRIVMSENGDYILASADSGTNSV